MLPKSVNIIFERPRSLRLAKQILKFIHPHKSVLDCGCGSMSIAELISEHSNTTVFGTDVIDMNETKLDMCLCPGEHLPFASNSVDIVLLIFVLHHSNDSLQILRECIRVARRRVIVFEDVYDNLFEFHLLKIMDWIGNRSLSAEMHLPFTFKTEAEWRVIFNDFGMELVSVEIIRPLPFLLTRHRGFILDIQNNPK